jgi:hypothetical protein
LCYVRRRQSVTDSGGPADPSLSSSLFPFHFFPPPFHFPSFPSLPFIPSVPPFSFISFLHVIMGIRGYSSRIFFLKLQMHIGEFKSIWGTKLSTFLHCFLPVTLQFQASVHMHMLKCKTFFVFSGQTSMFGQHACTRLTKFHKCHRNISLSICDSWCNSDQNTSTSLTVARTVIAVGACVARQCMAYQFDSTCQSNLVIRNHLNVA